mmetsp:Transcript_12680/g.23901  ORF Transcript_12680/g.23901 Transcript_12680/m.23901 type:complete len:102 (-) Transcript_12680:176-481(-)
MLRCCCWPRSWHDSSSSSDDEASSYSDDEPDYLYFPPTTFQTPAVSEAKGQLNLPPPLIMAASSLRTLDASPAGASPLKPIQQPGAVFIPGISKGQPGAKR